MWREPSGSLVRLVDYQNVYRCLNEFKLQADLLQSLRQRPRHSFPSLL
jgi:hypothetical protein